MCGIAGILSDNASNYTKIVKRMTDALYHRGPDAEGIYTDDNLVLGHRRLSIIDLNATGAQPMLSNDKNQIIVFNGEIYGFEEIRKQVKSYKFRGTSDTEVILALYEKYGLTLLDHLPGMFAFAHWDKTKKQLFCARDRFGEKPFYYALGRNNEFIFASEIKAILSTGLIEPQIDLSCLSFYLKHLYVPPNKTIYKNIHTLPAAHYLTFGSGQLQVKRYWSLPEINSEIGVEEAIHTFYEKLNTAVAKQLVSDVPIGAFLSGGLDSSTIVALAAQHQSNLNTFSFGFGSSINELPYAKEISEKYNTNHIELSADDTQIDQLLLQMAQIYDEPFADSSNIPTFLLSKLTRQYVTVALTGDGGDELCGGYGSYMKESKWNEITQLPQVFSSILKLSEKVANKLGQSKWSDRLHLIHAKSSYHNIIDYHQNGVNTYFSDEEIASMGLPPAFDFQYSFELENDLNSTMKMDIENYMPGDILVKIDRASMANSLELRSPFLDVDFATFCLQLPHRLKIQNSRDKWILREACGHLWTKNIRERHKQGFGAPVKDWMASESVHELITQQVNQTQQTVFNIIDKKKGNLYLKKGNYQSWIILCLSLWANTNNYYTKI